MNASTHPTQNSTGGTLAMWLHMYREGGRWTTRELRDALPDVDLQYNAGTLNQMARAGMVAEYRSNTTPPAISYGVTASCVMPRGIVLAQLMTPQGDIPAPGHKATAEAAS